MKKKILAIIGVLLVARAGFMWYGYHARTEREAALQKSIISITEEKITLNQVVPFAWDAVYTFSPYTPKEDIEAEIGFRSYAIQPAYSEGMLHLVFVKGKQVVARVCGVPEEMMSDVPLCLGYDVVFDGKITYAENAVFSVSREGGVVRLTRKE